MDKNITAILREDAKTIRVAFDNSPQPKLYTYVTHLNVVPGDCVVVEARGEMKLSYVRVVDDELSIEPNSEIRYSWVIAKVDMKAHLENIERNNEIEKALAQSYRKNTRAALAATLLAAAPEESRVRIAALIGAAANKALED